MDLSLMKTITTLLFLVLIGIFAVVSLMSAYVFIRYGRSKGVTIAVTLTFAVLFAIATASTFLILQTIF